MNNILDSINTIMRTLVLLLFAIISFRGYSQPQPKLILPDYDQYEPCIGLAFNPQKTLYYNLNSSGVLKFYESSTNKLLHSIGTDSLQVTQAIFVEEKRVLISAFSNSRKNKNLDTYRVYLFDLETSEIIYVFKEINLKGDLNTSKNGEQLFKFEPFEYSLLDFNKSRSLISIQYGKTIELWDLKTFEKIKTFNINGGISEFNVDGDFILLRSYFHSNIFECDDSKWSVLAKNKKKRCLEKACAIEVISKKNIVLLGSPNGELIVKDLNNWKTLKVFNLFDHWLKYIKYDSLNDQIVISDFHGLVKFLNVNSFEVEDEYKFEPGDRRHAGNVIKDKSLGKLFVLFEDEFSQSVSELLIYDMRENEIIQNLNTVVGFNENNISSSGILFPGLHGADFVEFEKFSMNIASHGFSWVFLSPNEKYLAHTAQKSRDKNDVFIWDTHSGGLVLSDSLLARNATPLGYDSNNQMFLYDVFGRNNEGGYRFDLSTKRKGFLSENEELPQIQNHIDANVNSRYFVNDYRPFRKNVIKSKIVDSQVLTVKTPKSTKIDTCHLVNQSDYLIFILDSLKSETIRFVDSETNRILWQKNYNSEVSYNICGNGEFILISESKELGLHLIEIKSGQRINLVEHSEKELHVALQFRYKLNLDGEWLVLQKSRKAIDDFYEFEFWNISQKTKMFELISRGELSGTNITIDAKLNRFISNHSGQFNYYSLSDGMKLGAIDLDVERDFSGYNYNENTCWLTDDNKYLIVADGTSPNKVSVYDNATLKKLYTRIQSPDGNWIAFDKDLNYDGSEGALKEVYYVKGLQVLSDYVPKESKHVPGLIEKVMSR